MTDSFNLWGSLAASNPPAPCGPSGVRRDTLQSYNPIIICNLYSTAIVCISARMMGTQNPRIPRPTRITSPPGPFKTIKNSWFRV